MSDTKPKVTPTPNGPYLVENLSKLVNTKDGKELEVKPKLALCRCGGSANKPYCDGTHAKNGFSSDKSPDRVADKRESFEGNGITVHDNRGLCAHAGRCTDGLAAVFRLGKEPFIDAKAASAEEIAETIAQCPSGALSYTIAGELKSERGGPAQTYVAPNGPYVFAGGAELDGVEMPEGATTDHFALCRCGASTNKPFCSGAHWNVKFDEKA